MNEREEFTTYSIWHGSEEKPIENTILLIRLVANYTISGDTTNDVVRYEIGHFCRNDFHFNSGNFYGKSFRVHQWCYINNIN